jgi:hypothetical protein
VNCPEAFVDVPQTDLHRLSLVDSIRVILTIR